MPKDMTSLGQYRWDPVPHSAAPLTWLTGMRTMTTAGDASTQVGMASHIYLVTQSMVDAFFIPPIPSFWSSDTKVVCGFAPNWA